VLVQGDIRSPNLDLGDPRLRGADSLAELLLGETTGLALTPNGEGESQPQLDELALVSGESEKIRRLAHSPACGGESLSFFARHGRSVTVRRLRGTLRLDSAAGGERWRLDATVQPNNRLPLLVLRHWKEMSDPIGRQLVAFSPQTAKSVRMNATRVTRSLPRWIRYRVGMATVRRRSSSNGDRTNPRDNLVARGGLAAGWYACTLPGINGRHAAETNRAKRLP
jgi:hypothetical protein